MSLRVSVDRDLCRDHGQCVFAAPDVFQLDDTGRLVLLVEEPDEALWSACEEAADMCPSQAITLS